MPATRWFDGHLDLAMLAELGRDLRAPLHAAHKPGEPAAVTFDSLAQGRVTHCLATIFTEPDGPRDQPTAYPATDPEAANAAGLRQLNRYQDWYRPHFYARLNNTPLPADSGPHAPDFLILIENADPILDPEDLPDWREAGVVAIGLAWAKPSRYAGGNASDGGVTDLGRALIGHMDRLGIVHDASHLSDNAFWQLADLSDQPIIASHSNCRTLLGGGDRGENQRHLHDDQIRLIIQRGGVIGLNLYSTFLCPPHPHPAATRATIDHCITHIQHVCDIAGDRLHVGLGSDMDGGFSASRLPVGIDSPADLHRLADALAALGWSDTDIHNFAWANWARFWRIADAPPHHAHPVAPQAPAPPTSPHLP